MSTKLWKAKSDLATNLRLRMPEMVRSWFTEGDHAVQPDRPYEEIHHFRLLTKRFRYTLEIFRQAYGPSLERMIEQLRELQTLLGDLNDCVATSRLLADVPGSDAARVRLDRKAVRKAAELRALWAKEFAGSQRRGRWERYLVRYACRPAAARTSGKAAISAPEQPTEAEVPETPLYTDS